MSGYGAISLGQQSVVTTDLAHDPLDLHPLELLVRVQLVQGGVVSARLGSGALDVCKPKRERERREGRTR